MSKSKQNMPKYIPVLDIPSTSGNPKKTFVHHFINHKLCN